jgi:hypothetical protein
MWKMRIGSAAVLRNSFHKPSQPHSQWCYIPFTASCAKGWKSCSCIKTCKKKNPSFEEHLALYLYKLDFPLPKNNLNKFDRIWPSGRDFFFKNSVYFYTFAIISLRIWVLPFLWTNLNPLFPRMISSKSD